MKREPMKRLQVAFVVIALLGICVVGYGLVLHVLYGAEDLTVVKR
jgi:hypothetical protein